MLKETADELGLTPYVLNNTFDDPLAHALRSDFYANLNHPDDPPIYLDVLNELIEMNNSNREEKEAMMERKEKEETLGEG